MMMETVLSRSIRLMFAGGIAATIGLLAQPVLAQETAKDDSIMQRVEITGSSIKRIAKEGALPVQTLTRAEIAQSGATNVADLVAALPAMQGFITASASVNGSGGGVQTASVHAIGSAYTLVLLNGHRMAPYSTGSAVNLASIPLSAVERVEILTDGASTLYGSDAIAGVVNFILKKNQTDFNADLTYNAPQQSGGKSANVALSKGWGNLENDGFNVLLAYSHDEQKELNADQRGFARSGVLPFTFGGKKYTEFFTSINSIPGNVDVTDAAGNEATFNPSLSNTGACAHANTFVRGDLCRYDFAATVNLIPEMKRDSFFGSGNFKLNKDTTLFAEAVLTNFTSTARFAAPAQPLNIIQTDPVTNVTTSNPNYIGAYNTSVKPLLAGFGVDPNTVQNADMYLRLADAGGRTDAWKTDAKHLVLGVDGNLKGWDYNASYTHSENTQKDDAVAGYVSGTAFDALIKSGAYNPFVLQTDGAQVLAPAVLHQTLDVTKSKIDVLGAHGSADLFKMAGGTAQLGLGADYTKQAYTDEPSAISQGPNKQQPNFTDVIIGGSTGLLPFDTTRNSWGTFAELLMPVIKNLDVTAAVRYDSYDAAKNSQNFDINGNLLPPATQGNADSKATYKLSVRYQPVQSLLLRGSYGSGFKAPTLLQITQPLSNGGSSNFHPCPITDPASPLFAYCKPGSSEYGLLNSGNAQTGSNGLKPEESNQGTVGFRLEPNNNLSFGVDFWDVKLKNQIQTLPEKLVFENPAYLQYISLYFDPIQKSNVLVGTLSPVNLSSSHYRGLDWDTTLKGRTPIGRAALNWSGTYMLKAEKNVPGSGVESSVGRFDAYHDVSFRVISRLVASLKTGDRYTNSLTMNYRSGYHDEVLTASDSAVRVVNADGTIGGTAGMARDVDSYMTFDWQLKADINKSFILTGGIKNLFNQDPPFSDRIDGGGNQSGYDGRYTDPLGRTFYVAANYKF